MAGDPKPWRPPSLRTPTKPKRERRKGPHRIVTLEDLLLHELALIEMQIHEVEKRRNALKDRLARLREGS